MFSIADCVGNKKPYYSQLYGSWYSFHILQVRGYFKVTTCMEKKRSAQPIYGAHVQNAVQRKAESCRQIQNVVSCIGSKESYCTSLSCMVRGVL